MQDIWNKDPAAWAAIPLIERLEKMRQWHCTGPCGQSASVIGTRCTLDATIREAQDAIQRSKDMRKVARDYSENLSDDY